MSDTNPTRPTEPIEPDASSQPRQTGNDRQTGPTERIDPVTTAPPASPSADDPAGWFDIDTSQTAQQPATLPSATTTRLPARFGTILWGVLLLGFAAVMIANSVTPFDVDPVTWLIGGLIAAGALLVIAGIAAAVRRTD
ncbi:MAG: hypothetical protein ABWX65_05135 [Mycetocola sp.]